MAVITPVRNAQSRVGSTIESVLGQRALRTDSTLELTYVIQDGASTDQTLGIIDTTIAHSGSPRVRVFVESQPDRGMYDALCRGFERVEMEGGADWYCYLNAGDLWEPTCLETLSLVDRQTSAQWLCGLHTYYSPEGAVVHTRLPYRYRQDLLRAGAYGRGLPTVQQESTFWKQDLHSTIDTRLLSELKFAGDAFLWWTFSGFAEPTIIQASLAGFGYHGGHLGESRDHYRREIAGFAGDLSFRTRALIASQRGLWEQPARIKARLNPHLYAFSTTTGGWVSSNGSTIRQSHV